MPVRYALDVFKAGANPIGILTGNQGDVRKLGKFYGADENQKALNTLPLDSQLFMRYLSGRGAQGMTIGQDRGQAIYDSIIDQQNNLQGPKRNAILHQIKSNYGDSHYQRVMKGDIPVYFGGSSEGIAHPSTVPSDKPFRGELKNSLGSFWATPNQDDSFDIDERYNFSYAPGSNEGEWNDEDADKRREMYRQNLSTSLNPADIGRRIVMQGEGRPFGYKLRVDPKGSVLVNPGQP